jgi:glycerol dehydrogenase-like iron-containing ADH family enzyme
MEVGRKFASGFTSYPKARFNAGSEHILAWAIEQIGGKRIIHGEAVCLSILLMSHIQQNNPEFAAEVVRSSKMLYLPEDIGTSWAQIEYIFSCLFDFAEKIPWYTIITEFALKGINGRRDLEDRFQAAKAFVEGIK